MTPHVAMSECTVHSKVCNINDNLMLDAECQLVLDVLDFEFGLCGFKPCPQPMTYEIGHDALLLNYAVIVLVHFIIDF